MSSPAPSPLLRESLLEGISIMLARAEAERPSGAPSAAEAVHALCTSLGARVSDYRVSPQDSPEAEEAAFGEAVAAALGEGGEIDMLVIDVAGLFAAGSAESGASVESDRRALIGALESSWSITRAVVNLAYLERGRPGRIVFLAPAPDGGAHADAACAGLENLARTLSIEWARHAVTPVTIAPAGDTAADELASLTAYLASPAGAYFSGCLLDLRGPRVR
jgi:NAD(P)-dependent dehydrogenase (short-subunit alcohol dehydrogenase family)